ncbi:DUF3857 domain-containing protein [Caulobacter sp. ErkDOM-E]|uniref:DUF3857 domain-containing protein n=1 Tax=Caulobacter sp. ErkDOM-E TaxID=3402778 RepID=UPI003AF93A20
MFGEIEGPGPVGFGPIGDWVEVAAFARPPVAPDGSVDGGRRFWLSDNQIDLRAGRHGWMTRVITEVVSSDGLQPTAQISIDFDPSYERIDIHHIHVVRGGVVRELDVPALINVFRRERDLERAMYDGRLTAHVVVPDLRIGDIVDYAYTQCGPHPALKGLFACEVCFQWGCWVGETKVRVVTDPERQIVTRAWQNPPVEQKRILSDGGVERVWISLDTPPFRSEVDVPGWARIQPSLRITDALSWKEVAAVFTEGYASLPTLPDDLEAEAVRIEALSADPAVRAVEALRLVQRVLRYHAVNLGDGGFVPRTIDRIWATRAGDCKDSSRLLVALLRRLGIEADPALVHTVKGPALDEDAPNVWAFNHCIVRARVDGVFYWLEPTRYPQGGRLSVLSQPRYGWALPLTSETGLQSMGDDPPTPACDVKESFDLGPAPDGESELGVEATYRGWRADDMRRRLDSEGPAALAQSYREYYERSYGRVSDVSPMETVDDLEANVLKITEHYTLARAWEVLEGTKFRFTTLDDLFAPHLTTQRSSDRKYPIEVGAPRAVSVETLIRTPKAFSVEGWSDVFEMKGVRASSKFEAVSGDRSFRLLRGVTVSRRHLDANEADLFFDLREGALKSSALILTDSQTPTQPTVAGVDRRLIFLGIWIFIILMGAVLGNLPS